MSKKWNSQAPSAFSSVVAVVVLLSAGAAVAGQGGLQQIAAGARDAMDGNDHSASGVERQLSLASPGTHSHGTDSTGRPIGDSADPANGCVVSVSNVRDAMPAASDNAGIAHALAMVQANCAKNPKAHGLIVALQNMGHGKGHAGTSAGKGNGKGNGPGGGSDVPASGHANNPGGGPSVDHSNQGKKGSPPANGKTDTSHPPGPHSST